MIRVVFVCLGNICRSPMAEAIFRKYVQDAGLEHKITVDSAGTGDWHIGKPPHKGTRKILEKYEIGYDGIRARQLSRNDMTDSHYIIAMDDQNMRNITQFYQYAEGEKRPYIGKLLDFASSTQLREVPDPYYTGNFDETYELVTDGCRGLLNYIIEKEQLQS